MYVDWERQFGMHGVKASLFGDTRSILNNFDLPMIPSNVGQKVEYNYDNKYFAQAAVTESYYNRYAEGRRWGTFWAVGLVGISVKKNSWNKLNGLTNSSFVLHMAIQVMVLTMPDTMVT